MKFKNKVIPTVEDSRKKSVQRGKVLYDTSEHMANNDRTGPERSDSSNISDDIVSFNPKTLEWSFQKDLVWFCGMIEDGKED